jgi:hypothetical protein
MIRLWRVTGIIRIIQSNHSGGADWNAQSNERSTDGTGFHGLLKSYSRLLQKVKQNGVKNLDILRMVSNRPVAVSLSSGERD